MAVSKRAISLHNQKIINKTGPSGGKRGGWHGGFINFGDARNRLSAEEKERRARERAENKALNDAHPAIRARRAADKAAKKLARNKERLRVKLASWGIEEARGGLDTIITDLGKWHSESIWFRCDKGHMFKENPEKMYKKRAAGKCPHCVQEEHDALYTASRIRLMMAFDEQGLAVEKFESTTKQMFVRDRVTGDIAGAWAANVHRWGRPSTDRKPLTRTTLNEYVFYHAGPKPKVLHPFIALILREGKSESVLNDRGQVARGYTQMRKAIEKDLTEGRFVVNISNNDSFSEHHVYTWGMLPVAPEDFKAYLDKMEEQL